MSSEREAIPSQRADMVLKRFNIWGGSGVETWITDPKAWGGAKVPIGDVDRSTPATIGIDLAQTQNLCAVCRLWTVSRERWFADFMCWLPEPALARINRRHRWRYEQAIADGTLELTSGPVVDHAPIDAYVRAACEHFDIRVVGADPYNATQLTTGWDDDGIEVMMVRQGLVALTDPGKRVERAIYEGRIAHDGDPFIGWQLANAVAFRDVNHNLKVRHPDGDPDKNIDAVTALIVAMAVSTAADEPEFFVGGGKRDDPDGAGGDEMFRKPVRRRAVARR